MKAEKSFLMLLDGVTEVTHHDEAWWAKGDEIPLILDEEVKRNKLDIEILFESKEVKIY